ncbi:hypothetical protein M5689_008217 [Euphorbia peplus]|nr:hypothetical protein M5689_008217 [Euphorbia peplus]
MSVIRKTQTPEDQYFYVTFILGLLSGVIISHLFIVMPDDSQKFKVPIFEINSAIVYPYDMSYNFFADSPSLTANWNLSITVKTQDSFILEDVKGSIWLKNVLVSSTAVEGFSLNVTGKQESVEKKFQVNLVSSGVPINHSMWKVLHGERDKENALTFSFNLSYVGTMRLRRFKIRKIIKHVNVLCDVKVVFVNSFTTTPATSIGAGGPFICNNIRL